MDSKVRVATWDRHNPVFCSLELFCRFRLRWLPNANPRPLLKSRILRFTKQSALGFPKFSLLRPWRPFCPFLHTHPHRKCQMAPNRKSETTLLCYFFTFTKQNFFRFRKFSLMRPWRPFCRLRTFGPGGNLFKKRIAKKFCQRPFWTQMSTKNNLRG